MPANNTTQIFVGVPVVALAAYSFSPQDSIALLEQIPAGSGTTLTLPTAQAVGEWYEFSDVDGSCAPTHPIILSSSPPQTIHGGTSIVFTSPFAWARLVWAGNGWAVQSGSGSATPALVGTASSTGNAIAVGGAFASILAAPVVVPAVSGGADSAIVTAAGYFVVSAAGTASVDVQIFVDGVAVATAFKIITMAASSSNDWSLVAKVPLTAGPHTIDIQAEQTLGAGAITADRTNAVAQIVSV
jgi:hypothetical protein